MIFKVLAQFGMDDIMDSKSASVPMYLIELQGPSTGWAQTHT